MIAEVSFNKVNKLEEEASKIFHAITATQVLDLFPSQRLHSKIHQYGTVIPLCKNTVRTVNSKKCRPESVMRLRAILL